MPDPGAPSGAVAEITFTAGIGPYQLSPTPPNALAAYFRFADVYANGATIVYEVDDTAQKEICRGIFDLAANTLTRTVLFSSNDDQLIDWPERGQRTVRPLVNLPLCPTPPVIGQVLAWDGSEWCPATLGSPAAPVPPSITLCPTPPADGQVLIWSAAENAYCPADLCALVAACLMPPVDAVYLDGFTASYFTNALTGVSDSPLLSFSFWINTAQMSPNGSPIMVVDSTGNKSGYVQFRFDSTDMEIFFSDASGSNQIDAILSVPADGNFHNILGSIDTNGTSTFYVDETVQPGVTITGAGWNIQAGSLGFAIGDFHTMIAQRGFSGVRARYCLGDVWYAPGQLLDFSTGPNRANFHDLITLAPVTAASLGATGNVPTGVAPAVFMTGPKSTFGTNHGTGGALTVTATVEDCLEGLHSAKVPATTRSGVTFDGADGQLEFHPPPFSLSDTSTLIVSVWLRLPSLPSSVSIFTGIYGGGGPNIPIIDISLDSSGHVSAIFTAADLTTTATYTQTTGAFPADAAWHHLICALDSQAGTMQVVVDRTLETVTRSGPAGFNVGSGVWSPLRINYSALSHNQGTVGASLDKDAAELWVSLTAGLDLSVSANLDKFELAGATVNLGSDGSTPLGAPPFAYCSQQPQGYQAITFYENRADRVNTPTLAANPTSPAPSPAPYP